MLNIDRGKYRGRYRDRYINRTYLVLTNNLWLTDYTVFII
jgi:hypothetical protein